MAATIDLSKDDAWDDSVLIDSWNDALKEYKKYHSIVSKVETEADLERELIAAGLTTSGELAEDEEQYEPMDDFYEPELPEASRPEIHFPEPVPEPSEPITSTSIPQPPIPPMASGPLSNDGNMAPVDVVKDEILKKALMGWYYAGYYTGLYEGMQNNEEGGKVGQDGTQV